MNLDRARNSRAPAGRHAGGERDAKAARAGQNGILSAPVTEQETVNAGATSLTRTRAWVVAHLPELVVVAFGLLLRLSLARTYDVTLGYDYPAHHQYVRYLIEHHRLPPYDLNFSTYQPPLFYFMAALIEEAGFSPQAVGGISIASSCLQLLLAWVGVELYLREWRLARVLALAIAAVVPGGVHIAGMASNEPLSCLFCTAAIVILPQVLLRRGRDAVRFAVAGGACLGLALLSKVSGLMVLLAFLLAVAAAVARSRDRALRLDHLRATAVVLAVAAALSGAHYVRHRVLYGKFVLTAYDPFTNVDPIFKIPYLDRRTLGYVLGWSNAIYASPYWSSALRPYPRFWPQLIATTFSDYYSFAFVARPPPGAPFMRLNGTPVPAAALLPSQLSVIGGTVLALLAAVAWLIATRALWRRGDYARLAVVLVAATATLGQLHFAVKYPSDISGQVKGAYLQFAAPVFCGLAAWGIAALWGRRRLVPRLLAIAGMAAIALVATYTIYAKIVVPLGA